MPSTSSLTPCRSCKLFPPAAKMGLTASLGRCSTLSPFCSTGLSFPRDIYRNIVGESATAAFMLCSKAANAIDHILRLYGQHFLLQELSVLFVVRNLRRWHDSCPHCCSGSIWIPGSSCSAELLGHPGRAARTMPCTAAIVENPPRPCGKARGGSRANLHGEAITVGGLWSQQESNRTCAATHDSSRR